MSRIYTKREDNFIQISDKDLANKILTDYKDLIDLIAGSPNEVALSPKAQYFHAETHQFHKIDEIKLFLEEKFLNNYVIPYRINRYDDKIILRVIIIPIEYDIIDIIDKRRRVRCLKINKVLTQ